MNTSDSSNDIPSAVFDSLSMGLDFSAGISFAKSVRKCHRGETTYAMGWLKWGPN
jgi:hypothetical protein